MGLYVGRSRVRRACTAPKHTSLDLYVVNGRLTKRIAARQSAIIQDENDCGSATAVTTLCSRELRRRSCPVPLCQNESDQDADGQHRGGRTSPPELAINGCNGFLFADAGGDLECGESAGEVARGGHKRRMGEAARLLLHSDCHKTRIFTNKLRTVPSRSAAAAAARAAATAVREAGEQEDCTTPPNILDNTLHTGSNQPRVCNGLDPSHAGKPAAKQNRASKRRLNHPNPVTGRDNEPEEKQSRRRLNNHPTPEPGRESEPEEKQSRRRLNHHPNPEPGRESEPEEKQSRRRLNHHPNPEPGRESEPEEKQSRRRPNHHPNPEPGRESEPEKQSRRRLNHHPNPETGGDSELEDKQSRRRSNHPNRETGRDSEPEEKQSRRRLNHHTPETEESRDQSRCRRTRSRSHPTEQQPPLPSPPPQKPVLVEQTQPPCPPRRRGRPPGRRSQPQPSRAVDASALPTLFVFESAPVCEPWFSTYSRLPDDCSVVPALSQISGPLRLPYQLPEDELYGPKSAVELARQPLTSTTESGSSSLQGEELPVKHPRVCQLASTASYPNHRRLARKSPRCHASTRAAARRNSLLADLSSDCCLSLDSSLEQLQQAEKQLTRLLSEADTELAEITGSKRSRRRTPETEESSPTDDLCLEQQDWFSLLLSEHANSCSSAPPSPAPGRRPGRRRTNRTGWPRKQQRRVPTPLLPSSVSESSSRHRRRL